MESLDELEHPLLRESPKHTGGPPGSLFKGILVRCEEDKAFPPLAWRSYCSGPPQQQQQLLDPCSLPRTLESMYSPPPIWGQPDSLALHRKEYLETTFVDVHPGSSLERKLQGEEQDSQSVAYSLEDEDDLLPDFEVRADTHVKTAVKAAFLVSLLPLFIFLNTGAETIVTA